MSFKDSDGISYLVTFYGGLEITYQVSQSSGYGGGVSDFSGFSLIATPGPLTIAPALVGCFPDYIVSALEAAGGEATHWEDQTWPERAFPRVSVDKTDTTVKTCAVVAAEAGSPYFGLEEGQECWWVTRGRECSKAGFVILFTASETLLFLCTEIYDMSYVSNCVSIRASCARACVSAITVSQVNQAICLDLLTEHVFETARSFVRLFLTFWLNYWFAAVVLAMRQR